MQGSEGYSDESSETITMPAFCYEAEGKVYSGLSDDVDATKDFEDYLRMSGVAEEDIDSAPLLPFLYRNEEGRIVNLIPEDAEITKDWENWKAAFMNFLRDKNYLIYE